jgi:hypothetical protein
MTQKAINDRRAVRQFGTAKCPFLVDRLGGSLDPRIDLADERPEIDWLGEKRLGTAVQRPSFCLLIAIGGDHDQLHTQANGRGCTLRFCPCGSANPLVVGIQRRRWPCKRERLYRLVL